MADNVQLNLGSGGLVAAADEISSVVYQRVKITQGADGVNDGDVSKANPMPTGGNTVKDGSGTLYAILVDANGRLQIDVVSALPAGTNAIGKLAAGTAEIGNVKNAGTFATQIDGAALTALQLIDDIVSTDDTTTHATGTTKGANIMAAATPTDGSVAANDIGMVAMSLDRRLHVDADITASVALDVSAATVTVAAHAVTNAGTFATQATVTSQPARDRLTDNVGVALQTDVILSDTTALTPKYAIIDAASSGNNTLLAAVTDKKIRVLSLLLVAAGTVAARFESAADGTALSGQMNLVANSGFTLPFNPVGWFETGSNALLNLELGGAVSVDGCLTYVEV